MSSQQNTPQTVVVSMNSSQAQEMAHQNPTQGERMDEGPEPTPQRSYVTGEVGQGRVAEAWRQRYESGPLGGEVDQGVSEDHPQGSMEGQKSGSERSSGVDDTQVTALSDQVSGREECLWGGSEAILSNTLMTQSETPCPTQSPHMQPGC